MRKFLLVTLLAGLLLLLQGCNPPVYAVRIYYEDGLGYTIPESVTWDRAQCVAQALRLDGARTWQGHAFVDVRCVRR